MDRLKTLLTGAVCVMASAICQGQTDASLFWRRDSLQVKELSAKNNDQYTKIGHHGPAVENEMMGLRLYFNDSGAIDVYSKSKPGLELRKYLWYPTERQMSEEGAGCDEYFVGGSLGLGGIALWDGGKMVRLKMTKERKARVGRTLKGHFAELTSYGIPYKGCTVDISVRIDAVVGSRFATVTAKCLSGQKVQFVTGVNFNEGAEVSTEPGKIAVWGKHPANVSTNPIPIGGGMIYNPEVFPETSREENMVKIISVPSKKVVTKIISASAKEEGMNAEAFKKLIF